MNATLAKLNRLSDDPRAATDAALIDAFLAGDQSAFGALVHRHAGLVFATCRRVLRHQQDAEDAFQATFLVLARRAGDVWPREAVGSWLFGVAHRVAFKARSVRSRRTVREQPLEDVLAPNQPQPDFDLAEVVHRVVCRLPEVYRAAVVACDLEGLSRKEAAERLGWTEGTLSGRLARARELLARRFRSLGLTLPAGGLAGLCAVPEAAPAQCVQTAIGLATGTVTDASANVAALTEGVVRSMALVKLKAMTAALFAACAIGFGTFAAAGHGNGNGDGAPGAQPPTKVKPADPAGEKAAPPKPANPPKGPRTELARRELEVFLQDVEFMALTGKLDKATLERIRARIQLADRLLDPNDLAREPNRPALTDADRLQGKWRVVSLTDGGKTSTTNPKDSWVVEFASRTLRMPYLETAGGWKQREYVFAVDGSTTPRTIDLLAPNKAVGRGIYEFTAPTKTCQSCHEAPNDPAFGGGPVPVDVWLGLCAPGLKAFPLGVRLALAIDEKRPAKFGGPGVIVFDLRRPAAPTDEDRAKLLESQRAYAAAIAAANSAEEKRRLEAELASLRARLEELNRRDVRDATATLRQAQNELAHAEAEWDIARAKVAQAQAVAEQHAEKLAAAKDRVKVAEKAFADATARPESTPAGAAGEVFTVHVRTLAAAEKVIRVKATGKDTVLEALTHAADAAIKSDEVSVWVVRDRALLPVDLAAILKGDAKTNHALKAGDQLFVQVKAAK